MRSPHIPALITILVLTSAALGAADFWESKPFREWSDKEAEKLLTDSPWAVLMAVPLPNRGPVPTTDAGGGGRGGGGTGGGGRGGGAEGFGPAPVRVRLTVSWRSALPLREAAARQQIGKGGTLSAEDQAVLDQDENLYVIGIQGLPPQYTRANSTMQAFLRRDGKPAIAATKGGTETTRGGALLLIGFPRTDPITLSDGDVEFDVKMGEFGFKKKFKLKDLVFNGKLAL